MRFRILIGFLFALIAVYVAYWFVVTSKAKDVLLSEIDAQRNAGTAIAYDELSVRGFPYRMEFVATSLDVSRAEPNGVEWRIMMPEFTVVVQPWKFTHAIAFSRETILSVTQNAPDTESTAATITAHDMRASVVTDTGFTPHRIAMELDHLTAIGDQTDDQEFSASDMLLTWRDRGAGFADGQDDEPGLARSAKPQNTNGDDSGQILEPLAAQWMLKAHKLTHPAFANSPYGQVMESLEVMLSVHGNPGRDLDRETLAEWRDEGGTIEISRFNLLWNGLDLALEGSVALDEQFRPLGALMAEVRGYEPVIDHVRAQGHIDAQEAETMKATLAAIAGGGEDGRVAVPIAMQSGRLFVGPLPLADLQPIIE